jgi:hypothetical protein
MDGRGDRGRVQGRWGNLDCGFVWATLVVGKVLWQNLLWATGLIGSRKRRTRVPPRKIGAEFLLFLAIRFLRGPRFSKAGGMRDWLRIGGRKVFLRQVEAMGM